MATISIYIYIDVIEERHTFLWGGGGGGGANPLPTVEHYLLPSSPHTCSYAVDKTMVIHERDRHNLL